MLNGKKEFLQPVNNSVENVGGIEGRHIQTCHDNLRGGSGKFADKVQETENLLSKIYCPG